VPRFLAHPKQATSERGASGAYWRTGRLAQQVIDGLLTDAIAELAATRAENKTIITHPSFEPSVTEIDHQTA